MAASLEVFNVLVPGQQLRRLIPTAEWQDGFQPHDTLLIAFSVLPYTDGTIAWEPIRLDTVPAARQLTLTQVVRQGYAQLSAYRQAGSPGLPSQLMDETLVPVLRRQGRYWVPRPYVLTSYFQVRPQPSQAYSKYDMATLNVLGRVFRMEQLLQDSIRRYGNPNMSIDGIPAGNVLQGRNQEGYEFWHSPNIAYSHAPRLHYGLGSFRYRPGIGLVSGSYQEYFSGAGQVVPDRLFDVVRIDGKPTKRK